MRGVLTFLIVFLLILSIFPHGEMKRKPFPDRSDEKLNTRSPDRLGPFLKRLCEAYNVVDQKKIFSLKMNTETLKQKILSYPKGDKRRQATTLLAKICMNKKTKNSIIPPGIQGRWKNPPSDIIQGVIVTKYDPRSLDSDDLKVRATFKSPIKNIWMGFCEFPIGKTNEIANKYSIIKLFLRPAPVTYNNLATRDSRTSQIRLHGPGNWRLGYTGQGVIAGVIDTGIDITHPDFMGANGTRILYIWDMNDPQGPTPASLGITSFNFGTVWTKADIDGGLCTETDTNGHGTHVCGSAAGNGGATGRYVGMAPRADIVFVKGLDPMGWEFIMEIAQLEGKACAINCSWGWPMWYAPFLGLTWMLPGDGTDVDSQYLGALYATYPRNGHIVVQAAGNEGYHSSYIDLSIGGLYPHLNGAKHAQGIATAASPVTHTFTLSNPSQWTDFSIRSDVAIRITYTIPGSPGGTYVFDTGDIGSFDAASFVDMTIVDTFNGEFCGNIYFDDVGNGQYPIGTWTITVQPLNPADTVRYDIWSFAVNTSFYMDEYSCFTGNYSYREYILDSAASPEIITVGAHTTRDSWIDINGINRTWEHHPLIGEISYFSSVGPNRTAGGESIAELESVVGYRPGLKPDISAPGMFILSAYSAQSPYYTGSMVDTHHLVNQGTSMSAPHVTGGIALIHQKHRMKGWGFLTADQIRRRFANALYARRGREIYRQTSGRSKSWGYGKLHLIRLNDHPICRLGFSKVSQFMSTTQQVNLSAVELCLDDNEYLELSTVNSSDFENFPLIHHFEIESIPEGSSPKFEVNGSSAKFSPDPDLEGIYRIKAWVNDSIFDSDSQYIKVEAKFYPVLPPVNGEIERKENRIGFDIEYINILIWENNSENKSTIKVIKIYRKTKGDDDSNYVLHKEVDPMVTTLTDRGLSKNELYTYKLTCLNQREKESEDVLIITN